MAARKTYQRAFGLKILNSTHPDVRRLKRDGNVAELHGHKFWNSSFLVMNYLERHPLKRRARVLEIGCGWGLLGIYCAKRFGAVVTGVDADRNVLPFLDLHAEANGVSVRSERMRFEQLTVKRLSDFDVILGADICFWDEMTPLLYNLIRRGLRAGVQKVILADPNRSPFVTLATRCEETLDDARTIQKHVSRPTNATGALLVVQP